jgi:ATP-dependent Clp protease adaptor protein ClpS
MLSVHHKGHGVAGVFTKDVAETKVAQVTDYAKEQGMPLRLSVEPE